MNRWKNGDIFPGRDTTVVRDCRRRFTTTPISMAAGAADLHRWVPWHGAGVFRRAGFHRVLGYCLRAPMLSRIFMGILQTIVYAGS
jgi:hypothetical protein